MVSRKHFIESLGATCNNWTWSWSFVNHDRQFVIFGVWDTYALARHALIFSRKWELDSKRRRQKAFGQSLEHLRLVSEEGYGLKTFPIVYSGERLDSEGMGPAKIKAFSPVAEDRSLTIVGDGWYASDESKEDQVQEGEVGEGEALFEGALNTVTVNAIERNALARAKCLAHFGFVCAACGFDFYSVYGDIGKEYIHVHHIVPLAESGGVHSVDPITDLIPVCPNCHAMIHRVRPALKVEELKALVAENRI